jgi:hypothetical protein
VGRCLVRVDSDRFPERAPAPVAGVAVFDSPPAAAAVRSTRRPGDSLHGTGFKWKNGSNAKWPSDAGEVKWKARGLRATQIPADKGT